MTTKLSQPTNITGTLKIHSEIYIISEAGQAIQKPVKTYNIYGTEQRTILLSSVSQQDDLFVTGQQPY